MNLKFNPLDKKMYIFGGWNGKTYFNDTMSFDLERMVWKKLDTVGKRIVFLHLTLQYEKICGKNFN